MKFLVFCMFLIMAMACGPATLSESAPAVTPDPTVALTLTPNLTPTPSPAESTKMAVEATKEHLASLPLVERMDAEYILKEEKAFQLMHDAQGQAKQWVKRSKTDCQHFFGSGNCELAIVELTPSEICGFKFHRRLDGMKEVRPDGHYYLAFIGKDGRLSGGYQWIASYQYQAYHDGAVLNIIQCWSKNPRR